MEDLEKLLQAKGVEVKPETVNVEPGGSSLDDGVLRDGWRQYGCLLIKDDDSGEVAPLGRSHIVPRFPGTKLESRPQDRKWGVVNDSKPLSSIRGTKLCIMGTTIDTAAFEAPDTDEPPAEAPNPTPLYNKSVQAFLQSMGGVNPPPKIDLPSREEAFSFTDWFFLVLARWTPVLHKQTHMVLVCSLSRLLLTSLSATLAY